jgi:putative endonuclease
LSQHNSNVSFFSKTTSQAIDWAVVYKEKYQNKALAIKREKEIKRWKSRKAIEKLIHDAG